ncbi:MAG: hypothetical protein KJP21_08315 [Bacteroidia bacterium]|nr:hypothetical protein [Bacteroidia bacterium]
MFNFLYTILSGLSPAILNIIGLFNTKIRTFLEDRKEGQSVKSLPKEYWIHCASLGEYEMAVPVIERLLESYQLKDLLITFFSPSGYNQAIKGKYKEAIMYLPFDGKKNVVGFYDMYQPKRALFIRYDFWYNFIRHGLKRGTRFYLINGRFTANHKIFGFLGKAYLKLLKQFRGIFVSDENSYKVLVSNDIDKVDLTGDTRFDRVIQLKNDNRLFPEIESFKSDRKLLILGSSWKAEEDLLLQLLQKKKANLAVIIAPHDIKRSEEIKKELSEYGTKLYTEGNFSSTDKVLIINTIGMLSSLYRYGDFALIGGGFSGALHNILEPAVWGCHISFGPRIEKFPEASDFIDAGFAYKIENKQEWINEISSSMNDEKKLASIANLANNYVNIQEGATSIIYTEIIS